MISQNTSLDAWLGCDYTYSMLKELSVGFNVRTLIDPKIRGFNRCIIELIRALRRIAPENKIHLFSDRLLADSHLASLGGCFVHASKLKPHLLWEQLALPYECSLHALDIFHAPINVGIPRWLPSSTRRVVTLHDMFGFQSVRRANKLDRSAVSFWISWNCIKAADAIITVSEYSKRQILAEYPAWQNKVFVIHNGIHSGFSPGSPDPNVVQKYQLQAPYVLYVGGFELRKNVAVLAQAFAALKPSVCRDHCLAMVGDGSNVPQSVVQAFSGLSDVHWLGFVSDAELISLYKGATCVVVPSLGEGFGLPLLEAMACGCPVLSSNAGSLPEIGGQAVAYFEPYDATHLTSLLERLIREPQWARSLRSAGIEQARNFSWENTAKHTLALYHQIAGNRAINSI
ncbi:MAG: glycosyltransferase family 4 protein [Deltaproteobacteria bacterium]|nr:glycosyltransferase family 4 protein [Deltaproteobacteria bacterium]